MALLWEWILALSFSGEQHPSLHLTDMESPGYLSAEKNAYQDLSQATAVKSEMQEVRMRPQN